MEERQWLEDYTVGETLVAPARTITETDFVNYAMISGDWHPIHVNAEYAKNSYFGQRILHGPAVYALGGSTLMWMGPNTFAPKSFIAFIEMTDFRLAAPTFIGDTLHGELTVVGAEPKSKGRGILTYHCVVKKQTDEIVLSWTHKIMVGTKPKE